MNARQTKSNRFLSGAAALALCAALLPLHAAAQPAGCGGSIGIATDPNTLADPLVFTGYPLQQPMQITLNPAAGGASLPLQVDQVRFALACADNNDEVPCVNGADFGDFNGEIPLAYVGLSDDPGTCGVTEVVQGADGPGTLRFNFDPIELDSAGCLINFDVLVNDIGTDSNPLQVTPAADANGVCLIPDTNPIEGRAGGSAVILFTLPAEPEIALLKQISVDGGVNWFDADTAASAPLAEFPSGAEYRLIVTNTGTVDLENVTVSDATLGIADFAIANLAAGATLTVDSGTIPALSQPQVCGGGGTFENIASVQATAVDTGDPASDSDPANLVCLGVDVVKTADPLGKVGDVVDYQIDLINNSGVDLGNCQAVDSLLDSGFGPGATLPTAGQTLNLSREVQVGDADPLVNEVTLTCQVDGAVNSVTLTAGDSAETNLFQPSVTVDKTGPEISKAGDVIDYTVTLANTSSPDTPLDVIACTATDPLKDGGAPFAIGFDSPVQYSAASPADASEVVNTVTVQCGVAGFTNVFGDSDSHTVDLISPSIDVTKIGPAAGKVGDTLTYTIGFTSTGSGALENCVGNDDVIGPLGAFESGVTRDFPYVVTADDADPLVNTATITCDVAGLDNQVSDSASHTADLITPAIEVTKTADAVVKAGDEIIYTIGFTNVGDGEVENCTGEDDVLGPLGAFEAGVTRDFPYTVDAKTPDPLVNTATITCDVVGFDNGASDSASHTADIVRPAVTLEKVCRPDPVAVGQTIEWVIDVTNSGDAGLDCLLNDPTADIIDQQVVLAAGATDSFTASRIVEAGDFPLISNTATVACGVDGFDNEVSDQATADCEVVVAGEEVCRTPGFWGTHAGSEKRRSTDLAQIVIDAAGGSLSICGATIDNTMAGNPNSAVEAMCVQVQGDLQRQLARQLTAMSLNCIVSGGTADCSGTSVEDLFASANSACAAGGSNSDLGRWVDPVDCFNNGGQYDPETEACTINDADNCQNRELDFSTSIFDGIAPLPGPAGSTRACSSARGNGIKVVPVLNESFKEAFRRSGLSIGR